MLAARKPRFTTGRKRFGKRLTVCMKREIPPTRFVLSPLPPDSTLLDTRYFDGISDTGNQVIVFTIADVSPGSDFETFSSGSFRAIADFSFFTGANRVFRAGCAAQICPEGKADQPATCILERPAASYGVGYLLRCRLPMQSGGEIFAELEWLFVPASSLASAEVKTKSSRKVLAARADVSGHISVLSLKNRVEEVVHFRGTGYSDLRGIADLSGVSSNHGIWARAHFAD